MIVNELKHHELELRDVSLLQKLWSGLLPTALSKYISVCVWIDQKNEVECVECPLLDWVRTQMNTNVTVNCFVLCQRNLNLNYSVCSLCTHSTKDDIYIFALHVDKFRVWSYRRKDVIFSLIIQPKPWDPQNTTTGKPFCSSPLLFLYLISQASQILHFVSQWVSENFCENKIFMTFRYLFLFRSFPTSNEITFWWCVIFKHLQNRFLPRIRNRISGCNTLFQSIVSNCSILTGVFQFQVHSGELTSSGDIVLQLQSVHYCNNVSIFLSVYMTFP